MPLPGEEHRIVPYHFPNNASALLLDILPNDRRSGDEIRSIGSFEDLDSMVRLAEEGRLPESSFAALDPPSRNVSFDDESASRLVGIDSQQSAAVRTLVVAEKFQKHSSINASLEASVPFDEHMLPSETTSSDGLELKTTEPLPAALPGESTKTTDVRHQTSDIRHPDVRQRA